MSNTSAEKQQTTRKYWVSKCSTESATELKCQREIKVGCCGLTLNAECGWNLGFISAWNCFSWLCSVSLLCSEAWSFEANIFKGKLCSGGLHACKSWFSFIWALDEPSLACFWSVLKMSKNNPSKQHLISLFGLLLPSELASQLAAAESRYSLLEKQLDYMRKMIQHAEREKTQLLEKQVSSQDYLRIK